MAVFGTRLKNARLEAGLSQDQLGLLAGLEVESASTRMNRYERGTRMPALELVERIGSVLDLPSAYFFAVSEDEAILLKAFHRMPERRRAELIALAIHGD